MWKEESCGLIWVTSPVYSWCDTGKIKSIRHCSRHEGIWRSRRTSALTVLLPTLEGVCGSLQVPAALSMDNIKYPLPLNIRVVGPKNHWTLWRKNEFLSLSANRTAIPRVSSHSTSLYIDWKIPPPRSDWGKSENCRFLDAFTKLRKATISFVTCLSVCPSAWNNSATAGRIFIEFYIWFEDFPEIFRKSTNFIKICLE